MFNVLQPPILGTVIKFSGVILANQNSVVVTHSRGVPVQINGIYSTDENANAMKIINEGANSFEVAWPFGMTAETNTGFSGSYV